MPSNHLILCHSLLLLPWIFSNIRVFSHELALCIRWLKYWSFSPLSEYSGLISFRIDWFDLLAFQRTLKNLLQHHNLKALVLWHSVFFMVQFSHLYMTTRKTITFTVWIFVSKVVSLLFNMLCRFVISFPSKKQASFNFVVAVSIRSDLGAQENKLCHCFYFFSICWPLSDGTRCNDLRFLCLEY